MNKLQSYRNNDLRKLCQPNDASASASFYTHELDFRLVLVVCSDSSDYFRQKIKTSFLFWCSSTNLTFFCFWIYNFKNNNDLVIYSKKHNNDNWMKFFCFSWECCQHSEYFLFFNKKIVTRVVFQINDSPIVRNWHWIFEWNMMLIMFDNLIKIQSLYSVRTDKMCVLSRWVETEKCCFIQLIVEFKTLILPASNELLYGSKSA